MNKLRTNNLLLILAIVLPLLSFSQSGINFEEGISWKQIKAKAKGENKYIFMDCYATWCGPCKYMDKNVFSQPEVGDYFNSHFVNVKVQINQTKEDPAEIKKWYADAKRIEKKYGIFSFPVYLFFTPEGDIIHRISGATRDGSELLTKASAALDSSKRYYTIISQYKNHRGDSAYLRSLIERALSVRDYASASTVSNEYVKCLKNPYTKDNLRTIIDATTTSNDEGFKLYLQHPDKIDKVIGEGQARGQATRIISREEIEPYFQENAPAADWDAISKRLERKYPTLAKRIIAEAKTNYYFMKKQIPDYEKAVVFFIENYGDLLDNYFKNDNAWCIFLVSNNKKVLTEALALSKKSIDKVRIINGKPEDNYVNYLDTYANLLYKLGDRENAILWEKKAIEEDQKVQRADKLKEHTLILEKMEKGTPTWSN